MPTPLAKSLAGYVCGLRSGEIPPGILDRARTCFLDWLGVTLQGAQTDVGRIMARTLGNGTRTGVASLIGTGSQRGMVEAALFTGTAGHALDFDDVHGGMEGHPSTVVFPAAVALAEARRLPARDLLPAFVAGVEVACRLGAAMNPDHYARGWHATGTLGVFGATAAAGKLLRLSPAEMARAFGIAGTQAAGIRGVFGTMAKPLNAGRAAANGLLAALLAGGGFTGPVDVFESRAGIFSLFGGRRPRGLPTGWGGRWAVEEIAFKRFASCYCAHAPMTAALSLRGESRPDLIRSIRLWVSPFSMEVASIGVPTDGLEAKFSLPFCTAVALVKGRGGVGEFSRRMVKDRQVQRLTGLVEVRGRRSLGEFAAVLEVNLRDGRRLEMRADANDAPPEGWAGMVEVKFLQGATPVVGRRRAQAILDRVRRFGGEAELGPVMALLVPVKRARVLR